MVEHSILSSLAGHLKSHIDSGRLSFLPVYLSTLSRLRALDLEVARGAQVRVPVEVGGGGRVPLCLLLPARKEKRH